MKEGIKISDHIVKLIENLGVKQVFLISGGGIIHVIDSIGKSKKLQYICNQHEQASAMAAESYARITNNIGVCIVTSGPGSTNTLTGVLGGWLDSIPMLIISGQVKREMIGSGRTLRQLGDQEINIVDIVRPITKYAICVTEPNEIQYHFDKAVFLAKSGRPGPVWLDVPLDIQGSIVNPNDLRKFNKSEIKLSYKTDKKLLKKQASKVIARLRSSKRPVLFVGNGVRLSNAEKELLKLINLLKIPVLTSFTGYDLVGSDNKYYFGRPGTVGQRAANFIIQNSDFLLVVGSRLNIRMLGYNYQSFAREAFKVIVDIDKAELSKKTIMPQMRINFDSKVFIQEMIRQLNNEIKHTDINNWITRCLEWSKKYPQILEEYRREKKYVNVYHFIETLSRYLEPTDIIAVSDGTACVCTYQTVKFPQGTRIVVNSGCAAMGYGLPAAIGVCFACNKGKTICIEGDGSIQLNLAELQTIVYYKLPIKIFVYNNEGYVSIRLTQKNLFHSHFVASGPESGVSSPNILKIAKAYGIKTERIKNHIKMDRKIKHVLDYPGPVLCEVILSPNHEFLPKSASKQLQNGSFVSRPLEDMYPFLDRKELEEIMIAPLHME